MTNKRKRPQPEVDVVTPKIEAMLDRFTDEEIATGVVARPPGTPAPGPTYDAVTLQERLANALLETSLGRLLRAARSTADLSLDDVAQRLQVSRARVHQLEQEGANLQLDTLARLAGALGYDVRISFIARDDDVPSLDAPLK